MEESEITPQTTDILADLGEIVLDSVLEGILKELPFFNTAIKLSRLSKTINDRIFLLKVQKFLLHLNKITPEEKQLFLDKLDNNFDQKSKVGECLLLILNRLDDLDKAQMLAVLFLKFIKEKINLETFRRLASAIDIAFVEDLKKLLKDNQEYSYLSHLTRSGLTETSSTGVVLEGYGVAHISVQISELGKLFVTLMNENE